MEKKQRSLCYLAVIFMAVFILGAVWSVETPVASAAEPIKIGSVIPLTGPYSHIARAQRMGAMLAVEEINKKGGVLGRPLKLYVRDSELKSLTAIRRLEELISVEKIDWHVGTLSGGISMAINEKTKKIGMPYMAACQTVEKLHRKGVIGPYTYTVPSVTHQVGFSGAEFVLQNLGRRLYIIYADYAWGQGNRDGWIRGVKKYGGEIIGMDGAPLGSTDFSPYLTKARSLKPDVLVLANAGRDTVTSLKQIYEMGLQKEMKIYSSWSALPVGMGAKREFQGVYAGIDFLWTLDLPSTKTFVKLYMDKYGEPPDSYSYATWAGINELASAANRAGSIKPEALAKELDGHTFDWGKGPATWRACDNTAIQSWWIVRGKKLEDIKRKWDIFEVVDKKGGADYILSCKELGY